MFSTFPQAGTLWVVDDSGKKAAVLVFRRWLGFSTAFPQHFVEEKITQL
jgi:hypothetical protein